MVDRQRALEFVHKHRQTQFYQPVIFVPGVIEIRGKWHDATKQMAEILFKNVSGKSVLDLGCSYGFFLHEAKRRGASRLMGVDHDPVSIDIAKEVNDILDHDLKLVHSSIDEFYTDELFDIILMMNVVHILKNPQKTISRYLSHTKEKLILAHDYDFSVCDFNIIREFSSLRSAGLRQVTEISPRLVQQD